MINRLLRFDFSILDICRRRASGKFGGVGPPTPGDLNLSRLQRLGGRRSPLLPGGGVLPGRRPPALRQAWLIALLLPIANSATATPPSPLQGDAAMRRLGEVAMQISTQNQSLASLSDQISRRVGHPVVIDRTVDATALVSLVDAGPTAGAFLIAAADAAGAAAMPIGQVVVIGPVDWLDRLPRAAAAAPDGVDVEVLGSMLSKLEAAAGGSNRPNAAGAAEVWVRLWQHRVTLDRTGRDLRLVPLPPADHTEGDRIRGAAIDRWRQRPAAGQGEVLLELKLVDQPAGGALALLAQKLGLPLEIDPAADAALRQPVTATYSSGSIEALIDEIATAAGVRANVEPTALRVSAGGDLADRAAADD